MMKYYGRFTFILVVAIALTGIASAQHTNLLVNPGVELTGPNFFEMLNDGIEGAECIRASDTAWTGGDYSFKVVKPAATTDPVGWKSVNNADLYWNNASDGTFTLSFYAKTEGVNTEPATDDASIGVLYEFYAEGSLIGEKFVKIDQSVATADFTQVQDVLLLASAPDEIYATAHMGKDATGTVWFDNISCGTDPWSMGVFNGGAEVPVGWMNWSSGEGTQFCNVVDDTAHTGDHSVLLHEEDDADDEMVFYSEPTPAEAGKWYKVSVWMKSEDIDTAQGWFATNITPDRDNDRIGITFFFHKDPIYEAWDLVGGDQFFYIDQRPGKERAGWTLYSVVAQAPEEAAGVSMRARFTSFPKGKVWYDDFVIEELEVEPNILTNPGVELTGPNFFEMLNDGMEGAECIRASDTAWTGGDYSFKVVKPAATTDPVGWKSTNNADLYWNNASDGTFTLSFYAKTEGVNTEPATDDASIGVLYEFYAEGSLIGEKFVKVDQSVATADFTQVQDVLLLASAPDEIYATAHMGKDATGTVWFDNISCGTDPWSMGVFNGGAEVPDGWMNWKSGEGTQFANVVDDTARTGDHSVLLFEEDDTDDEMVFYSEPAAAEAGKWYMVSVWMKSEDINTHDGWFATNITPDRDNDRIGITFFFHKEPLYEAWDLVGGDQFFYIDQRTGKEREDWTLYKVIAQAPEEAAGVSMRARFTSFPTGSVWYDDFSIQEVSMVITAIENPTNQLAIMPAEYELFNNYPNPFNPETVIEYKVPNTGKVKLAIYNVLGQNVKTLVDMNQPAGTYTVMWDGTDNNGNKLASGVYFYQLIGENALITKKMTLIK